MAERLAVRYGNVLFRSRQITLPASADSIDACYERGSTDGLPVVPSTRECVFAMLKGTTRSPSEVVGRMPPDYGECTVETWRSTRAEDAGNQPRGAAGYQGQRPLAGRTGDMVDNVATGGYDGGMRAVGIKTLKNKLSEYVRVAADGETILVTDRDRVVAELGPPQAGRAPDVSDALLADVARRGWLRPPIVASNALPPRKPVMRIAEVLRDLEADRRDR